MQSPFLRVCDSHIRILDAESLETFRLGRSSLDLFTVDAFLCPKSHELGSPWEGQGGNWTVWTTT